MNVQDEVRNEMRKTNDVFCNDVIARGEFDALDRVYTVDATVLPPSTEMVKGREAVKEFWRAAVDGLGLVGASLTTVEVEMCGESAVEIGQAELRTNQGGVVVAKYLVHWKREGGGWRWDKDIWNS